MSHRVRDLIDGVLGPHSRAWSDQLVDLGQNRALDHLLAESTAVERMVAEQSKALDTWAARAAPDSYTQSMLRAIEPYQSSWRSIADPVSQDRLAELMDGVGLRGLRDADLTYVYGQAMAHDLGSRAAMSAFDQLALASAARFANESARMRWIDELVPAADRLGALAESIFHCGPFDDLAAQLLDATVGAWTPEVQTALDHAASLRVRRGIFRELNADPYIERLPFAAIDGAIWTPSAKEPKPGEHPALLALTTQHPLTKVHRRCYDLVGSIELFLRWHINAEMTKRYGPDWFRQLPAKLTKPWLKKFEGQHPSATPTGSDLLDLADFAHLVEIIGLEYESLGHDLAALSQRLDRIRVVRNASAHYHALTHHDYVALKIAVIEIFEAFGAETFDEGTETNSPPNRLN